jgi:hypothetical protein
MRERATESRQRFTIGHKTPLQRRMLLNDSVYDQNQESESKDKEFNPFKSSSRTALQVVNEEKEKNPFKASIFNGYGSEA